jgi:hypothetical protein
MAINPNDFSTPDGKPNPINNQYLTYAPGTTFVYHTFDENGVLTEIRTVTVTNQTKIIEGVTCTVVTDVVTVAPGQPGAGQLIEKTEDYFAQDDAGNVWYFGEAAKNYENGKFVGTEGSWLAGKKGAEPGIVMLADPQKGITYKEENAVNAQDTATVTSLNGTAQLEQFGSLNKLLVTLDLNPLEKDPVTNELLAQENKYYSNLPGFNNSVFEQTYELDEQTHKYVLAETEQLYSVTVNGSTQLVQAMASFGPNASASATPLTTASSEQQGTQNLLSSPGHHA